MSERERKRGRERGLLRPRDGQDSGVPRRWPVGTGFSSHALGEEGGELGKEVGGKRSWEHTSEIHRQRKILWLHFQMLLYHTRPSKVAAEHGSPISQWGSLAWVAGRPLLGVRVEEPGIQFGLLPSPP